MAQEKKNWEAYDTERMQKAINEMSKSANLRFFFRSILNGAGINETPEGTNALLTARACGRHSIAMDIVATIREYNVKLYPLLLTEDNQEQRERSNDNEY